MKGACGARKSPRMTKHPRAAQKPSEKWRLHEEKWGFHWILS